MTHVGPTAQSTRAATPGQKRADISQVLEQTMRRVSTAVSVVTVLLMLTGFIITVLTHPALNPTGQAALAPSRLFRPVQEDWGFWAMSVGIVLLALLPTVRVILALGLFLRSRAWPDVLVALVVLFELLFSIWVSR